MAIYIELFHGRLFPDEELDDWGFQGPVLGPIPFCHITYGRNINIGDKDIGIDNGDLVELYGAFYGDFSIFDQETLDQNSNLRKRWEKTTKTLSSTKDDWPLMIDDEDTWVRLFAEKNLRGVEKHGDKTSNS